MSWRRINFIGAVGWSIMLPVSIATGWVHSVAFISVLSIYALAISHVAAWRADVPTRPQAQDGGSASH